MSSSSSDLNDDLTSIDWSSFEPGSVQVYAAVGGDWLMGRAIWRRSPSQSLESSDLGTAAGEWQDPSMGKNVTLPKKDYFGVEGGQSMKPFTPLVRPPQPPILSLPSQPAIIDPHESSSTPIPVCFFIARAGDTDGQVRLRSEIKNTEFIYNAGLPILPTLAAWTDRYGNLVSLRHLPPQGLQTFREAYIIPFNSAPAPAYSSTATSTSESVSPRRGLIPTLGRFLEHSIQLVSAVEALHECGFILRCGRADSWLIIPESPSHPDGVVVLGNSSGVIQFETDAMGETSIVQTLLNSDHRYDTENWMVRTHVQYLAPEVLGRLSAAAVDARADIYSIGANLYECLTGRTVAEGFDVLSKVHQILSVDPTPVFEVLPEVGKELSGIVEKCLAKAPQDRYLNAHSLRYDLEQLVSACNNRADPYNTDTHPPLIDVGAMDDFSRFRLSDQLVGVEESIVTLKIVLEDAHAGHLAVASIRGSSGTGKTVLACSIHEEVESKMGGRFLSGKYDSTSYNAPLAPIWQIVNQLARPLLALPEVALERWRVRLRDVLGTNMVPFFEASLESDIKTALCLGGEGSSWSGGGSNDMGTTPLPPSYKEAFYGAIKRFLSVFVSKSDSDDDDVHRPLVLLIDDVQWSSTDDLVFFRQLLAKNSSPLSHFLVIFAFRDNEGSNAFQNSDFRDELCNLPHALHTKLLERQDIYAMLKKMLKHPEDPEDLDLRTLAASIHAQCLGNAQQCQLLLRNLHQNKSIRFDWSSCTWKWTVPQIGDHTSTDSALAFWESLLAGRSTSDMRKTIFAAAAISTGGTFSLQLLSLVIEQPLRKVTKLVETLAQEARVFSCIATAPLGINSPAATVSVPTPASTPSTSSEEYLLPIEIQQSIDSDQWMFVHDQLQQAATMLLPISERALVHSQVGAALSTLQGRSMGEATLQCLVYNLNESRRLGLRAPKEEDLKLIRLNILAAKANLRSAAGPTALQHLEEAKRLIGKDEKELWDLDYSLAFSLAEAFIECYALTAEYQPAIELATAAEKECLNDVDKLTVTYWHVKALINLNTGEALTFGLGRLAEICGMKIQGDCDIDALRTAASFGEMNCDQILESMAHDPPPMTAAQAAILASLFAPSFAFQQDIAEQVVLHGIIAAKQGFTEYAPMAFAMLVIFKHGQGFHKEANVLSDVAGNILNRIVSPYTRIEVRLGLACSAQYGSGSLRSIASTEISVSSEALNVAHWEFLGLAVGHLIYVQLMGGANHVPHVPEEWIASLKGRISWSSFNFVGIGLTISELLSGKTVLPISGVMIRTEVPIRPDDSLSQTHSACCEAILSLLFHRFEPTLLDRLLKYRESSPGILQGTYYPFFCSQYIYALSEVGMLQDADNNLKIAEMEVEKVTVLHETLQDSPNFHMPCCLAQASRLEHLHRYKEALALLEGAIDESLSNGPTLLLGMAYERAGSMVKKWTGSDRLSRTYLNCAYRTYKDYGAAAKCEHMLKSDPYLIEAGNSIPTPLKLPSPSEVVNMASSGQSGQSGQSGSQSGSSGSASANSSDSVDLATLISAVSTWQREKSASRVAASLVQILIKSMGARYGALALMSEEGTLRLSVAGTLEDLRSDLHIDVDQCGSLAPSSLFNYSLRSKKTILDLSNARAHVGMKNDPFFLSNHPRSIFVLPIFEEDSLRGICYLDSSRDGAFSKSSMDLVGLLSTGAAVAIERVHLLNELDAQTRSLEHTVRIRTAAAEAAAVKAEQASLAQARFLQTMSHEMRTPLNSVVVLSDLLLEAKLDPILYEYVSTIKASSNDLLAKSYIAVIRDVLDFSRLETKSVILEHLPFDLTELIDGTLDQLSEVAANKNIELLFATNIGHHPPPLRGDATRVKQCLYNLLSNALKFTGDNGSVTVTASSEALAPLDLDEPSRLKIKVGVVDTGMGIQASKIPLLFKKFSQIDNSTTRLFGGSGLGLAIVRELAQLMNGDAWCESDYGKGSTFYFSIEADSSPQTIGAPRPDDVLTARSFQGKQAIIITPPNETRKILIENLVWLGFDVISWEPGTDLEALLHPQVKHLDLVILASMLPPMLPASAIYKISSRHRDARFIVISARRRTSSTSDSLDTTTFPYPVELLSTPLKTRALSDALIRLFRPVLPASTMENPTQVQKAKKQPAPIPRLADTCPMTILCVDDNAVNVRVLQQVMRKLGYETQSYDVAFDGQDAVEKCRTRSYDLVLMDLQMPRMDGTTAMKIIQKESPLPTGPAIVAVTASAMSGDREEALKNGFQNYVSKPIILSALIDCMAKVHSERVRRKQSPGPPSSIDSIA